MKNNGFIRYLNEQDNKNKNGNNGFNNYLNSQIARNRGSPVDPNEVVIEYDENSNLNQPDKNLIINGGDVIMTGIKDITANKVTIKNLSAENARLNINANDIVIIENLETSGNLPKTTSNKAISINTNDVAIINSSYINQSGYNAIEIGLNNTAPREVNISGVEFNGKLANNAISLFAHAPNAELNITDCVFDSVSNAIRISNRDNVPLTINLTNCQINEWDSNPEYAGILIFQDYTSKSESIAHTEKRFANITVNFNNVIGPDGNKILPETLSNVLPGGTDEQIAYVYYDKGGLISYENGDEYPKFSFK